MDIEIPAKVTIVAMGPGVKSWLEEYRAGEPEAGPGFIIGINNAHDIYGFKPDLIVAMDDLKRDRETHPEYVKSIVGAGCPVVTCTAYPEWPSTVDYPLREVIEHFSLWSRFASKVLNNTCSYALALAGYGGASEIRIRGYDFVEPDDPAFVMDAIENRASGEPDWFPFYTNVALIRRPSEPGLEGCAFWVGRLSANGQSVWLDNTGTFLDHDRPDFFYGYQEQPEL